jgi:DNA-binding CsgD family transcriptional regulator
VRALIEVRAFAPAAPSALPELRPLTAGVGGATFAGRASELESITQRLREAQSGKASSVLVQLSGYRQDRPRTPLVGAVGVRAPPVLRAACDVSEQDLSCGVIGQLVSRVQVPLGRYPLLAARAGEPRRAAARFARARDLFAALGAQPFLQRYREDFADQPSLAPPRGWRLRLPEVTDRERDITQLIGRGLTDGIAARSFVSSKTVECHLSHICQKLSAPGAASSATWSSRTVPSPGEGREPPVTVGGQGGAGSLTNTRSARPGTGW